VKQSILHGIVAILAGSMCAVNESGDCCNRGLSTGLSWLVPDIPGALY